MLRIMNREKKGIQLAIIIKWAAYEDTKMERIQDFYNKADLNQSRIKRYHAETSPSIHVESLSHVQVP